MEGEDSVERKIAHLAVLFQKAATDDELRDLVRSFATTGLRIGLSTKSVENIIYEFYQDSEDL